MSDQESKIDRYLRRAMSSDEQKSFAQQIASDRKLAEQIELQRKLQQFFEQREPALENQIEELGDRYFTPQKPRKVGTLIIILLIPMAILLYLFWPINDATVEIEEFTPTKQGDSTLLSEPASVPPVLPSSSEGEPAVSQKPTKKQQPPQPTPSPIAEIAVDYTPNPFLENLMREQVRGQAFFNTWISPPTDTTYEQTQTCIINIVGKTTDIRPFEFRLYSNKSTDFLEDKRLLTQKIQPQVSPNDTLKISTQVQIKAEAGLYYWLIVNTATEQLLHSGKVKIQSSN